MCRSTTCRTCGKTTWAGCGRHVDAVMKDVPPADRCRCDRATTRSAGWLAGLFERGGR